MKYHLAAMKVMSPRMERRQRVYSMLERLLKIIKELRFLLEQLKK
jgi:hypothetical protein